MAVGSPKFAWLALLRLLPLVLLAGSVAWGADEVPKGAAEELITATYFLPPGYIAYEDGDDIYFVGGSSSSWYDFYTTAVFGGDDDDDDDDVGPIARRWAEIKNAPYDDATMARLALAQQYGLQYPEGTTFAYSPTDSKLVVRSSPAVLDRIEFILHWEYGNTRHMVRTSVTVIRIGTGTAADWGLDGLPPVRPESSPFGGPVPRSMSPKQSARFFAALRRTDGFEVVATTEVVTLANQSAAVRGVDVEHQGEPDAKERLGVQLWATPILGDDERTLDMELQASYTDVIGRRGSPGTGAHGTDRQILLEHAVETRVVMGQGSTLLLGAAQRKAPRDAGLVPDTVRAPADSHPVFFVLTATVESVESRERLED